MNSQNRWGTFLSGWILANGAGWFLVTAIFILPYWGIWATIGVGFFLSLLQWPILKHYIAMDSSWLWLSTPAYGVFLFSFFIFDAKNQFLLILIPSIAGLGLLGFLQRSALNYYVKNATLWVFVSPVASILGMVISLFLDVIFKIKSPALYWAFSGILYGLITGLALLFMQNSTIKSSTLTKNGAQLDV